MKILFLHRDKTLLYDGERFEEGRPKDSKHLFCAASVSMHELITHTIRLPAKMSQEQLQVEVELKIYEEAQLDPNEEYRIDYVTLPVEDGVIVEAFAYAKKSFDRTFGDVAKRLEAIDLLFPSFLAYEIFYEEAPKSNDIFLHIGTNEAYALFYKEGRYIGHRLLDSLEVIAKKSGIELAKLKELLEKKGLVRENYDLDETHLIDALEPIFMQNIEKVVYSINQKRSLFLYDRVDKVYLFTDGGSIEGVDRFFGAFGVEGVEILPLDYRGKKEDSFVYLQADYALAIASGKELLKANLTFLERRPPLWRYRSFQWVSATIVLTVLVAGGYFYANSFVQEQHARIASLKSSLAKRQKIMKRYQKRIEELKKQKEELQKQKERIEEIIRTYEVTLEAMPLIKQNKLERERFMNDVVAALAKYRLKSEYIHQKSTKWVEILLVSRSAKRENIAKFLQRMLDLGYTSAKTTRIWNEEGVYKSLVKVER